MIRFSLLSELSRSLVLMLFCVLFVADIYSVLAALIYKLPRKNTAADIVNLCLSAICFLPLSQAYYCCFTEDVTGELLTWLYNLPIAVILLAFMVNLICTCLSIIKIDRWRKNNINPMSIKDGTDKLPMGICYHDKNGVPRLVNHRMEYLCRCLLGEVFFDGFTLWQRLREGDIEDGKVIVAGETPIFSLPDGSAVAFSRNTVRKDKDNYYEITAVNITKEYHLNLSLQQSNDELREFNRRLRQYGENVNDIMREKEILSAKINIHDELGETLLATKNYLEKGESAISRQKLLQLWQSNIALFRSGESNPNRHSSLDEVYEAARIMGISLEIIGRVPEKNKKIMRFIISGARECLTNAVHHARATKLTVEIFFRNGVYFIEYTNDGKAPEKPITEGGGLSYLRQSIEGQGGFMLTESLPVFRLKLKIPVEGGIEND